MTTKKAPSACQGSPAVHRAFTDREPERVSAHLRDCTVCSAEWESLEGMVLAAKQVRRVELSTTEKEELRAKLLVGARVVASESRPRRSRRQIAGAVAGLGLLVAASAIAVLRVSSPVPASTTKQAAQSLYRATIHGHAGARFTIVSAQPDESVRLYEGTITVDVAPLKRGERFRVVTRDAEVEVHGTVFDVSANYDRLARVTVERGRVEVRGALVAAHTLVAGESWATSATQDDALSSTVAAELLAATTPATMPQVVTRNVGRQRANGPPHESGVARNEGSRTGADARPVAPHDSPSPDELAFQQGWAALRSGDPLGAHRSFATVHPNSSLGQDAAFWQAIALARAGRLSDAAQGLERFLAEFPSSAHRDEALVTLGELLHRMSDDLAANARFRAALNSPNGAVRLRAQRGLTHAQ